MIEIHYYVYLFMLFNFSIIGWAFRGIYDRRRGLWVSHDRYQSLMDSYDELHEIAMRMATTLDEKGIDPDEV